MNIEIKSLTPDDYKSLMDFYSRYGDRSFYWYEKKLKKEIMAKTIIGKICLTNGKIIGAYLGRIQTLLTNPSLKGVQSIDTLIAPPYRGGKILLNLARKFYEFLKMNSYNCIYGLPNNKIEKFRYKFLNWKLINPTYSYTIYIPIFFLRIFYYFINLFIKKKKLYNFEKKKIDLLKKNLRVPDYVLENKSNGAYWIASHNAYFTFIGLFRTEKNLNILQKFILILIASSKAKGFFLKTYSTDRTETAKIFEPFSIKKKALNFSGLFFSDKDKNLLKKRNFEFIEFDTFGLL